ncbi:MAG: hypothetical protein RBR42_09445 [Desulfomicrobium sp.]|nr:hypothetical protein [Desulfomicrobium sp.]NLV95848.1 hypothetical protein [Desulfovibrionales bacterium]
MSEDHLLLVPKNLQLRLETCPSCGYNRQRSDNHYSSPFECPKCGIVYALAMEEVKKHNRGQQLQDEAEVAAQKSETKEIQAPQMGGAVFATRERLPSWLILLVILGCVAVIGLLLV